MFNASLILRSLALFLVAGLCEIAGGWLVWQ
jgi:drug/metabolite transporter superfamily protein YnfA